MVPVVVAVAAVTFFVSWDGVICNEFSLLFDNPCYELHRHRTRYPSMSLVFLRACDIFFTCHKKYHTYIFYKRVTLYLYDIIDILLYDCMILLVLFCDITRYYFSKLSIYADSSGHKYIK